MKRMFTACLALLFCLNSQARNPQEMTLEDPASWTMVIIPDPQSYTKFNRNQPILDLMMQWVKDHVQPLNIGMVLCTGDLVEQNNIFAGDGVNGNQTSAEQWEAASRAFAILDPVVPYILCTGNHDYGVVSAENRYTQLNSYFPPQRNKLTQGMLRGMLPNAEGVETLENAWYEFTSPQGQKFLVFSLEFNPRKAIVEQAREVANRSEYKDHKIIWLTHSYLNADGKRIVREGYPLKDVTHGQELWEKLISLTSASALVICGHIGDIYSHRDNVGFSTERNRSGKVVNQMVFNAQTEGGGWHGNGGDGWLRVLEFLPDGRTVRVKTFSPFFAISPSTEHLSFRTEDFDQFEFTLD